MSETCLKNEIPVRLACIFVSWVWAFDRTSLGRGSNIVLMNGIVELVDYISPVRGPAEKNRILPISK